MGMSDVVAAYILKMLEEENGIAEIRRNELAGTIGCVPSQINYVITSRFTAEQGYTVESRRGGGGYVRITRSYGAKSGMIMHIVNSIGENLDAAAFRAIEQNMLFNGFITKNESEILNAAVSDRSLSCLNKHLRDKVRASIVKNILLAMNRE